MREKTTKVNTSSCIQFLAQRDCLKVCKTTVCDTVQF